MAAVNNQQSPAVALATEWQQEIHDTLLPVEVAVDRIARVNRQVATATARMAKYLAETVITHAKFLFYTAHKDGVWSNECPEIKKAVIEEISQAMLTYNNQICCANDYTYILHKDSHGQERWAPGLKDDSPADFCKADCWDQLNKYKILAQLEKIAQRTPPSPKEEVVDTIQENPQALRRLDRAKECQHQIDMKLRSLTTFSNARAKTKQDATGRDTAIDWIAQAIIMEAKALFHDAFKEEAWPQAAAPVQTSSPTTAAEARCQLIQNVIIQIGTAMWTYNQSTYGNYKYPLTEDHTWAPVSEDPAILRLQASRFQDAAADALKANDAAGQNPELQTLSFLK